MSRSRIAVIGGGISGNLAARLLHDDHDVTLFEAGAYSGGHARTVACDVEGTRHDADIGFMVFNHRTYPNFCRLLKILGVEEQDTDMSFSVRCHSTGLEYEGSGISGLLADWRNACSPRFLKMLADIIRFNRVGTQAIVDQIVEANETMGEFLDRHRFGQTFRAKYLIPMAAAIWSADPKQIDRFPAQFFLGFCHNHGLMQIQNRPQWKTIAGRSKSYVDPLVEPFKDRIRLNTPIRLVRRFSDRVVVETQHGESEVFDFVVMATHADRTLKIIREASTVERHVLSAFPYQPNDAILHTDESVLPKSRNAWASWNYSIPIENQCAASVTYDLSRLQNIPSSKPILLTLNPHDDQPVDSDQILGQYQFDHPAYQVDSADKQRLIARIQGMNRTYFCGAYCGYGFHEDGVNSALAVAAHFGKSLDTCEAAFTKEPSTTVEANPSLTSSGTS